MQKQIQKIRFIFLIVKPGIYNLLQIYSGFTNIKLSESVEYFKDKDYKFLKVETAKVVSIFLEDIQTKYKLYIDKVDEIALDGKTKS